MTENRTKIEIGAETTSGADQSAPTIDRDPIGSRVTIRDVLMTAAGCHSRAAVLALLGRPISWGMVQHWMSGRKRMPSWAVERVCERLASLQDAVLAAKATRRGEIGKRTLGAYWAHRRASQDRSKAPPGANSDSTIDR